LSGAAGEFASGRPAHTPAGAAHHGDTGPLRSCTGHVVAPLLPSALPDRVAA